MEYGRMYTYVDIYENMFAYICISYVSISYIFV